VTGREAQAFHIRARLARKGGNQFYKARGVREVSTLCGAPVTAYDSSFAWKAAEWTNDAGQRFVPCAACVAKRAEQ
jgi:hypothetical protein